MDRNEQSSSSSAPAGRASALAAGSALVVGGILTVAVFAPTGSAGQLPRAAAPSATATLVQLTNEDVPAIGMTAYAGTYGTASSIGPNQLDNGDFSDPDAMLDRMTISTMTTRSATTPTENSAQAQLTDLRVMFNGRVLIGVAPTVVGVASLDSYAQCVPPPIGPLALAYNRTDAGEITVMGEPVSLGMTDVAITGAELGVPTVGDGILNVTVTRHEDPATQSARYSAEAWLDIAIDGTLRDTAGAQVYQGRIAAARLGEVHADCVNDTTPTPTATTPTANPTTATPTSTPTPTGRPTTTPPTPPTGTPTRTPTRPPTVGPTTSPTTAVPSVTPTRRPTTAPRPTAPPARPVRPLAATGAGPGTSVAVLVGGLHVAVGTVTLIAVRRRGR